MSGRSPRSLLDGLAELRARSPETAERLEVVFAGPTTAEERELLADERLGGLVRSVGALDRPHALALQRAADSLLVVAAEGASTRSVATNKLFEYLAARRPVLVLGDESEAARIVTRGRGRDRRAERRSGARSPRRCAGSWRARCGLPASELDRFAWPSLAECFEEEIEAAIREHARRT